LLWNLIDQLAKQKSVDLTIADLAQRIMSRDLFKLVPISSREVQEFIEQPDAYGRIHAELKQFVPGQAEFYLSVDYPTFSMFSPQASERAYFVDVNKDTRSATQIQDHPEFRIHWREEGRNVRLFVPREAVSSVAKLISR